jgi:hypothetical protein
LASPRSIFPYHYSLNVITFGIEFNRKLILKLLIINQFPVLTVHYYILEVHISQQ